MKKMFRSKLVSSFFLSSILIMLLAMPSFASFQIKGVLLGEVPTVASKEMQELEDKLKAAEEEPSEVVIQKVYTTDKKGLRSLERKNEDLEDKIETLTDKINNLLKMMTKQQDIIARGYVNNYNPVGNASIHEIPQVDTLSYNYLMDSQLKTCNARISKAATKVIDSDSSREIVFLHDLKLDIKELTDFPSREIIYSDLIDMDVHFSTIGIVEYVVVSKKDR